MSSDDLDNSTAALLQPTESDSTPNKSQKDEESVALKQGQPSADKKPDQNKDVTPSSQPDTQESAVDPAPKEDTPPKKSDSPAELKVENENQSEQNQQSTETPEGKSEKPASSEPAASPTGNNHDVENPKEDQIEEEGNAADGDKSPIAPKSSKASRLRPRVGGLSAEKARMATSIEDIGSLRLWKGIVAEFLGTMLLTMIGCGSCISMKGSPSVVQIALCFGLSVATIVWAIGHVSGGHINPAVTMAMLATRKISLAKAVFYIIFQLIGAILGAGLLYGLTPSKSRGSLGATVVHSDLDVEQALGIEIFITFVLVFTVFASVDSKRRDLNGSTPLTIGLSVTMCHLFAVDYTGSSMNTARSFGPAVVIGEWDDHWVYWLGPIIGGVFAGLLYDNLFAVNASLEKAKACLLSSDYDDEKYQARKMKICVVEEDPDEPEEEVPLSERKGQVDNEPSNIPYIDE